MLEYVASMKNYVLYHDTKRGNYKIHNGIEVVAYPSTVEDAYDRLRAYTKVKTFIQCAGCNVPNCNECEKFYD